MFNFDALNYDPETPGFYVVLLAMLLSFFLSSVIAITYQLTTPGLYRRHHFLQSMILIGMVAAMIMQAIGDSVARGLGILGALSIIRFRTVLDDPRNITFMFASLGVGIAAGVLSFTVALTSTLIFCLAAFMLRASPLSERDELIGSLRLRYPKADDTGERILTVLDRYCRGVTTDRVRYFRSRPQRTAPVAADVAQTAAAAAAPTPPPRRDRSHLQEVTYQVRLKSEQRGPELLAALDELAGVEQARLTFEQRPPKL